MGFAKDSSNRFFRRSNSNNSEPVKSEPKPSMLGSGLARGAAEKAKKRKKKMQEMLDEL